LPPRSPFARKHADESVRKLDGLRSNTNGFAPVGVESGDLNESLMA
jgi:hypothetical protein